jgi:hypothetical protein
MPHVKVTGTISASVDKIWSIVRDFGNLEWGGITGTTLEGVGVGAVRTFSAQGVTIRERVEAVDDLGHTLTYSILEPSPIPWTGHLATIALHPEPVATRIEWSGHFEPRGLSEDQVAAIVRGIFENGIRNLKRTAEEER